MNKLLLALAAMCLLIASAAFGAGVSQAKLAAVGSATTLDGVVTHIDEGECYIESEDRSAGIWVLGPTKGLNIGDVVSAAGTRSVIDGEPCVTGAAIAPQGRQSVVSPFSMNNRTIGGSTPAGYICDYLRLRIPGDGYDWKWTKRPGASNTGLLVKTWGTVKAVYYSPATGVRWFYIDDGSRAVSDYGDTGVLVYSDAEVEQDDFVAVTGISSSEPSFDSPARLIRVIRTRDLGDVAMIKDYQAPEYPFSDEFDSPTLDPRWFVYPGSGSLSLTGEPGSLILTAPPATSSASWGLSPQLVQELCGDCDIEIKVRVPLNPGERPIHRFRIAMKKFALAPETPTYDWVQIAVTETGYTGASYSSNVALGSKYVAALTQDTCYFRIRRRAGTIYANVSFDGVNYPMPDTQIATLGFGYLALQTKSTLDYNGTPEAGGPFSAYVEYFRYTSAPIGGK